MKQNEIRITHIRGGSFVDHKAITAYQWINPNGSIQNGGREATINWMRANNKIAFVQVGYDKAYCDIKSMGNINYLETRPDRTGRDNLLSLPQF